MTGEPQPVVDEEPKAAPKRPGGCLPTVVLLIIAIAAIPRVIDAFKPAGHVVPNVVGERPDAAKRLLKDAGLDADQVGGSLILPALDAVCSQTPEAGEKTKDKVTLYVESSDCDGSDEDEDTGPPPTGSPAQPGTPEYQLCKEAETEYQKQQAEDATGRSC